jgi:exosortase H (IPTLxxWG-CTERM-specific)
MARFVFIFVGVLVVLFLGELTSPIQQWIVLPWTSLLASVSALLLQVFDANVVSHGKILQNASTGVGVAIEAGCNGIEACIILVAALAAYPARWQTKAMGMVAGFVAIQALNLLRIISLFYLAGWNAQVFEFAHLYLWQALIMLDVLVVWLLWIRWVARQAFSQAGQLVV